MSSSDQKLVNDRILKMVEEDNEAFLRCIRNRFDRVGMELPKIEMRFEDLEVEGETYVGQTALLPTLLNALTIVLEGLAGFLHLCPSRRKSNKIIKGVSGILKPSRLTLLLGSPGSGKTTLLKALAGKLDDKLRVSGNITYNGHGLDEFVPQRTCAYIGQRDLHTGEMTVRETIDFSARCLGTGSRSAMLSELVRREKEAGITPDPLVDAFMKATGYEGWTTSLATDYTLKALGLETCADIVVGDEMRRGISGGEKKRLTIGELLAGPARALLMDEVSNGLDSSTTFQIVNFIRQVVHVTDCTVIISLLQPPPETFDLFDDVILMSDGQIVFQGPRESILEFFEYMGFKCPERKCVPDFLQEVISRKDQVQYWSGKDRPSVYVSVSEFAQSFRSFYIGEQLSKELRFPFDKSTAHPVALEREKYGISGWELFKACLYRDWLLLRRNYLVYVFKIIQVALMSVVGVTVFIKTEMHQKTFTDGGKYFGALFYSLAVMMFNGMVEMAMTVYRLPVFYKQRDSLFYPPWAFGLSYCIVKVPISLLESGVWVILTYYTIGFAPAFSRFLRQLLAFFAVHQMSLALFRFIAAAGRTLVISTTLGSFIMVVIYTLGGFIISKDNIQPWWIWGYWASPMMYGQNAISINEFLDHRWNNPNYDTSIREPTLGRAILRSRGMFVNGYWYWISTSALIVFSLLFNTCFILALSLLKAPGSSIQSLLVDDETEKQKRTMKQQPHGLKTEGIDMVGNSKRDIHENSRNTDQKRRRGMVLPFQPMSLSFHHISYWVDIPTEMKRQGMKESRLQLLRNVSGAFRPGILTALVGVSGAGKTTLMDVLAGRKTGGYIEGSIYISGYPKKQDTFARISGYCEQNDIHSPHVTVYESLVYSAWLRLAPEINQETGKMFVEEVLELVELNQLRNALVGLPGVDGLSTEQRKRLTIAVELVSNPSIIFMDEPTSGLDARSAAIVMRTVRNTVDTGRTVVCTIHQPSIDVFESFDELLLMQRGGRIIYAGELGSNSCKLIEYFEAIPGVPRIKEGCNPAAWILDVTSFLVEDRLNIKFADVYFSSSLYRKNQALIQELSSPLPGSRDLRFSGKYAQTFGTQCKACLWKQFNSYWRNLQYNGIRFFLTIVVGLIFGTMFWKKVKKMDTQQDLLDLLGAMYVVVFCFGVASATSVQPIVAIERTVFYRERAAGMYSSMSYAFAQVIIEVIYIAVQALSYSLIIFPMMGFSWQLDNFLWFIYFIFMSFLCFILYGMMVMAMTPSHEIAGIVSTFLVSFWNLFAGVIIPRPLIPIWWRWFYWATPVAWTIYGVMASQLGDEDNSVQVPGKSSLRMKDFLKEILGFDHSFLPYVAVAHVGFIFLFVAIFCICIKYLNFQRR